MHSIKVVLETGMLAFTCIQFHTASSHHCVQLWWDAVKKSYQLLHVSVCCQCQRLLVTGVLVTGYPARGWHVSGVYKTALGTTHLCSVIPLSMFYMQ